MKKIIFFIILVVAIAVVFWFLFYQKRSIVISGILVHQTQKAEFFQINNQRIVANPELGITRDLLITYANKKIEVTGTNAYIKEGVSGPGCEKAQTGCERKVRVILPKSIKIVE